MNLSPFPPLVGSLMQNRPIPLEHLQRGQTACISRVAGHPDHVLRLEEFGLRGGARIEMFRPGSPCIVRLAGNKLCLRPDDRVCIHVVRL